MPGIVCYPAQLRVTDFFSREARGAAAAKVAVQASVAAATQGAPAAAAAAPLAVAALTCRGGKLRSAWPKMAMGRAFVHMDLRVLTAIANNNMCRGPDDNATLAMPTKELAKAQLATEAGWDALEDRDRNARALRRLEILKAEHSRKVFKRLFKPGRAVKVPRGAYISEVVTDNICGKGLRQTNDTARECAGEGGGSRRMHRPALIRGFDAGPRTAVGTRGRAAPCSVHDLQVYRQRRSAGPRVASGKGQSRARAEAAQGFKDPGTSCAARIEGGWGQRRLR